MTKLSYGFIALLTFASVACSEGFAPSSPLAPGSLVATEAKGGGKPAPEVPVTTTIHGDGDNVDFDIASDGGGPYTTSVIQNVGAWLLDLTSRSVYLNFRHAISGSGPASGLYEARLIAQCNRAAYNESMLAMSSGGAIACPLYVRFDAAGGSYRITMNAREVPGSDDVTITCTSGAPCSAWEMTPGGTGRGVLDKQGRGTTWVRQGTFHFAFQVNVARP